MDHVKRSDIPAREMAGRIGAPVFGENAYIHADDAFMAYVTFAPKYGTMETHYHDDEMMYVVDSKDAYVRYGASKDKLDGKDQLFPGDLIRARKDEWHRFDFDSDDGYLDMVIFFATPKPVTINESDV
jgi:quercetin dioxygenase-like cupin family protein